MADITDKDESSESLAERYVAGRMTEGEEREFEVQMVQDPALAAEVDTIQRLREGFKVLARRGELAQIADAVLASKRSYAWAAAAAVIPIGAGMLMMHLRGVVPPPNGVLASSLGGLKATATGSTPATLFLTHTRGGGLPPEAAIAQPGPLALKMLPAVPGSSGTYAASLERLTDRAPVLLATEVPLHSDATGYVLAYLNPDSVGPGTYRLTLRQAENSEAFEFRLK